MPDAERWRLSDVISVDDGTLVVFRWLTQPEGADPADRVLAWSPTSNDWVRVETEPILTGTDSQFAQGGDGRIYSYDNQIDPATTPWNVEPFTLADPSEAYAGYGLDAGPDGRIYRPATGRIDRATFEIYDPVTTVRDQSSSLSGHHGYCVLEGEDLVYIVDMVMFAAYDPVTDAWSTPISTPGDRDCIGAGLGPDGRLYLASMWSGTDIVTWDPSTSAWLSVEPPPAADGFRPRFVTGPDGRLWAIDPDTSFVFVPDR